VDKLRPGTYGFGPFVLDLEQRLLLRAGETVPLSPKVFDTLAVLVAEQGKVVDKAELLRLVWPDTFVEENNLTQNISALRKFLGDYGYIETIPRRGYRFIVPVEETHAFGAPSAAGELSTVPEPTQPAAPARRSLPAHEIRTAVGILIALGVVGWLFETRRNTPTPEPRAFPLTSYMGTETVPAFSPDGKQVAFVWSGENGIDPQLYVKLIGTGTKLRISTARGAISEPAWSPDGRYLAFYRAAPGASGYYVVPALGGPERLVLSFPDGEDETGVDWFPDSKRLAIGRSRPLPAHLMTVVVETGEQHILTSPPAGTVGDRTPNFSPDGRTLVFARYNIETQGDFYLMDVAGGRPRRLTTDGVWKGRPTWTEDSREVIYNGANPGSSMRLWRVPVHGGAPQPIPLGDHGIYGPAVAHHGNRLAYVVDTYNTNLWRVDLSQPSAASAPVRLISSTQQQDDPQYSPDGKKLAFYSNRSGSAEIWVSDFDGLSATQLTNWNGPPCRMPRWSPDGSQIAFQGGDNKGQGIWLMRSDGFSPRRLTAQQGEYAVPAWSRDGNWIYFSSNRDGNFEIWKMPASTGETPSSPAVKVTRNGGFNAYESRDSKYLYFAKGREKPGLWRVSLVAGANATEMPVLAAVQSWGSWALATDGIYFVAADGPEPNAKVRLKFFDLSTGRTRELAILERSPVFSAFGSFVQSLDGLTLSPDELHLVYAQIDQHGSDIMLVENFR
jgi:Tol biopolymer transport system component/DNA-binding winged helix-turn-helix (wHTH) protein